jgi:hypothetical protein
MLQTVDRLVEVLDEGDQDRWRVAGEHQRLDRGDLPAQPVDRVSPVPGRRCDGLHDFEYAMTPGRKAIVKSLWCGAHVMVASGDTRVH